MLRRKAVGGVPLQRDRRRTSLAALLAYRLAVQRNVAEWLKSA
jgi:hypothetical protein